MEVKPITFSAFILGFKMCIMNRKDKLVANSEKILHFFLIFGLIFSWVKKGIFYHLKSEGWDEKSYLSYVLVKK